MGEICALHNMNDYMHFIGIVLLYIIFIVVVIYFIYNLYCKHNTIIEKYNTPSAVAAQIGTIETQEPSSYYDSSLNPESEFVKNINTRIHNFPNHDITNNNIHNIMENPRNCTIRFKKEKCTESDGSNCQYTFKDWKETSISPNKYISSTESNIDIGRDDNGILNLSCFKEPKGNGEDYAYNIFNMNKSVVKALPFNKNGESSFRSQVNGGTGNYIGMAFVTNPNDNYANVYNILEDICSYQHPIPPSLPSGTLYKLNLIKNGDDYKIDSITTATITKEGKISDSSENNINNNSLSTISSDIKLSYDATKGITMQKGITLQILNVNIYKFNFNNFCDDKKIIGFTESPSRQLYTANIYMYENNNSNTFFPTDGVVIMNSDDVIAFNNLFAINDGINNIDGLYGVNITTTEITGKINKKINDRIRTIKTDFNGTKATDKVKIELDKQNELKKLDSLGNIKTTQQNNVNDDIQNIFNAKFIANDTDLRRDADNLQLENFYNFNKEFFATDTAPGTATDKCITTNGSATTENITLTAGTISSYNNEIWSTRDGGDRAKFLVEFKDNIYSTKLTNEPSVSIDSIDYTTTQSLQILAEQQSGVTGWRLVRFLPPTSQRWYNTGNDNLVGTITYGTSYDYNNEFSVPFGNFDEFLFSTKGMQHWLQVTKTEAIGSNYNNSARTIIKSSISSIPYTANWYNRSTAAEDPWIGLRTHNTQPVNDPANGGDLILYSEYTTGHWSQPAVSIDGGVCVFVRTSTNNLSSVVTTPQAQIPADKYQYITLTYENAHPDYTSTTDGNQRTHTINFPENVVADILVVGGGGGGGIKAAGGGGAGGLIFRQNENLNGTYIVRVGKGGDAITVNNTGGLNGYSSSFGNIIALGGGGGGAYQNDGKQAGSGGSGGGSFVPANVGFDTDVNSYGNNGGVGKYNYWAAAGVTVPVTSMYWAAGGGGGAGSKGQDAGGGTGNESSSLSYAGGGGNGLAELNGVDFKTHFNLPTDNSIGQYVSSENKVYFAGGGGGSNDVLYATAQAKIPLGGKGGGGNGINNLIVNNSINALANSGGGGGSWGSGSGSSNQVSGKGGSGIVIIRYYYVSSITHKYLAFTSPATYTLNVPEDTTCDVLVINNTQYYKATGATFNGTYNVIVGSNSKIENETTLYEPNSALTITDDITGENISYGLNSPIVIIRYFMGGIISDVVTTQNVVPVGYLKFDGSDWNVENSGILTSKVLHNELCLSRYLSSNNYSMINIYEYSVVKVVNNVSISSDWYEINNENIIYIAKEGYTGAYPTYQNNFVGNILKIRLKSCSLENVYKSFLIDHNSYTHNINCTIKNVDGTILYDSTDLDITKATFFSKPELFGSGINLLGNIPVNVKHILELKLYVSYDASTNSIDTTKQQTDKFYLFYEQF